MTEDEVFTWVKEQFKAVDEGSLEPELARKFIEVCKLYKGHPTFQRIFNEYMIEWGCDEDDKNDGNDA